MFCPSCGQTVAQGQSNCPACGREIAVVPPAAAFQYPAGAELAGRVQRHLQILASLWLGYAGITLLLGILVIPFLSAVFGMDVHRPGLPWEHTLPWLVPFASTLLVLRAAVQALVGFSLLTRRSWGRIVAMVIGILSLFHFPFGTALGAYTLWVLACRESRLEYEQIAMS